MAEIKIIQAPDIEHPFAVIYKPSGLASAPLFEGDESALSKAMEFFPEIKYVAGKKSIEYGLLHRIDTETSGLLLIASTQESYDFLCKEQKNGRFIKYYRAQVELNKNETQDCNFEKEFTVVSAFRPFGPKGRMVKPVFENSSAADRKKCGNKIYSTDIKIKKNIAVCRISEGYRHQVRAHLAYSGYPICGDKLYNPNAKPDEKMQFEAFRFEFTDPKSLKNIFYEL